MNEINLQARWDITDKLQWDNTAYHVSELPSFRVADYWRIDTRLGYNVREGVEAELIGQNLFNDKHREFTSPTDPAVHRNRTQPLRKAHMQILTRTFILALAALLFAAAISPASYADEGIQSHEREIKAGLLYNFLKYTDFPDSALSGASSISVSGATPSAVILTIRRA